MNIGSRPCEKALESILSTSDARVIRRVMSIYMDLKADLKAISGVPEGTTKKRIADALFQAAKTRAKYGNNLPYNTRTHLLCCMTAEYREKIMRV